MPSHENLVITIVGPTCTGKTSLAIKLSKMFNGSIISADSRQVVKYMDVGTGKVPVDKQIAEIVRSHNRWAVDGVEIYGYDLINPDEYFSAFDFLQYFTEQSDRINKMRKQAFLVGGTGMYVDVALGRLHLEGGKPDPYFRKELERLSLEELRTKLLNLSPEKYQKIDLNNPVRMIRAIEKLSVTRPVSPKPSVLRPALYIGLTSDRETLYSRADLWIEQIFGETLFAEIRRIKKEFPGSHRLNGLIYKSAVAYLENKTGKDEAKQEAKFDMHAYIRRQHTWFKRNPQINWFDIQQKNFDSEVTSLVESKLNG